MMITPLKHAEITSEQIKENRLEKDEIREEIRRQVENLRQAGYQEGILSFFDANETKFVNQVFVNTVKKTDNLPFNFLLVVPKNFKSIYDQVSSLGTLAKNINPLETSDIATCPNKPYCLLGLEIEEIEKRQSVDELKAKQSRKRFGLTDVEIVSLLIQFPYFGKYQIFATGSYVNKTAHPFLRRNEKGKIEMLSASGSYTGFDPREKNLVAPSCELRSA